MSMSSRVGVGGDTDRCATGLLFMSCRVGGDADIRRDGLLRRMILGR